MRILTARLPVLLGLALFGACEVAAGAGGETEAVSAGSPAASAPAASAVQEPSCWLRNATMDEAMARPSPLGETVIALGGQAGKICYGRPSARDRVVEGGLIPFDGPWRMGANEAAAIHLPFPAIVGGIELEPGSYSLYTNAGESQWEIVLNSVTERWGAPISDEVMASDIGSFMASPQQLSEAVEQFTIGWRADSEDRGHVVLEWGTTRVEFEVRLRS